LCANIAGSVSVCSSIVSELTAQIQKLGSVPMVFHDHIRNAIREAQLQEMLYRLDYELTKKLATRLTEWKTLDKASLQYRRVARLVNRYELPMQLTVGGFVKGSPVLLESNLSDAPEIVSYSAIGSGMEYAHDHLGARNQNENISFQRTIVHVAEAMERARQDKDVGEPSDYVVLSQRSLRRYPARNSFLDQLLLRFFEKPTDPLDDTEDGANAMRSALYFPNTTKDEYARGLRRPTGRGLSIGRKKTERIEGEWMITIWDDDRRTFSLPRGCTIPTTAKA
jgi:hypothetical protein